MQEFNILVTSVGSTTSIGIIKFIRKSNIHAFIVGTDINDQNRIAGSAFCDKFYKTPFYFEQKYIAIFQEIVIREKIQILIPVHDQEIEIFSRNKREFEAIGCRVIVSHPETIEKVNDKLAFAQTLEQSGILSPKTYTPSDWVAKNECTIERWLLKPIHGVSSRGIIIGKSEDLKTAIKSKGIAEGHIVQEFIQGIEYTVDVFVKNKISYCAVPRIREEVREGLCYKASTVGNANFISPVKQILQLFDFYGPINIQFIKCEATDKIYCIECNPRFGGSSIISLHAGVNLFDFIVQDYSGGDLEIFDSHREVYMTRYWEEIFYEK